MFCISLLIIPAVFSWLPPPRRSHVRHLDRRWVFLVVHRLERAVSHHRKWVYIVTLASSDGRHRHLHDEGDGQHRGDLPQEDAILADLNWFEDRFGGVMPFEVVVRTGQAGQGRPNWPFLKKVERLQKVLAEEPQLVAFGFACGRPEVGQTGFFQRQPSPYTAALAAGAKLYGPLPIGTSGEGLKATASLWTARAPRSGFRPKWPTSVRKR